MPHSRRGLLPRSCRGLRTSLKLLLRRGAASDGTLRALRKLSALLLLLRKCQLQGRTACQRAGQQAPEGKACNDRPDAPTAAARRRRAAEAPPPQRARQPGARAEGRHCAMARGQSQSRRRTPLWRSAHASPVPVLHAADAGEGGHVRCSLHTPAGCACNAARSAERPPARRRLHVRGSMRRARARSAAKVSASATPRLA